MFLLTFTCFPPVYISPPLPGKDAEGDRAGGGARWSTLSPVAHQFHFRDLWGHRFLSSRQHIGNMRWGRGEWNTREKERRQRPRQWWSHGKSAPPVLKRDWLHSSPSRERKSAQTACTHTATWLSPGCYPSWLCSWCKVSDTRCLTRSPLCKRSSLENSISRVSAHHVQGSFAVVVFSLTMPYCHPIPKARWCWIPADS